MPNTLYSVIMAGGSGTRFWPASRRILPKQFLSLAGPRTLLQDTVDRCLPWIPLSRVRVVTNATQAEEVARTWFTTPWGGGRHQARIDKITAVETKNFKGSRG